MPSIKSTNRRVPCPRSSPTIITISVINSLWIVAIYVESLVPGVVHLKNTLIITSLLRWKSATRSILRIKNETLDYILKQRFTMQYKFKLFLFSQNYFPGIYHCKQSKLLHTFCTHATCGLEPSTQQKVK